MCYSKKFNYKDFIYKLLHLNFPNSIFFNFIIINIAIFIVIRVFLKSNLDFKALHYYILLEKVSGTKPAMKIIFNTNYLILKNRNFKKYLKIYFYSNLNIKKKIVNFVCLLDYINKFYLKYANVNNIKNKPLFLILNERLPNNSIILKVNRVAFFIRVCLMFSKSFIKNSKYSKDNFTCIFSIIEKKFKFLIRMKQSKSLFFRIRLF